MSRTEYMREAKRRQRERYGEEWTADYWLNGGRARKAAYWAANKDEINARRRGKRAQERT